jgi:hypothetical protein
MSFWYELAAWVYHHCLPLLEMGFAPFREAPLTFLELQLASVEAAPKIQIRGMTDQTVKYLPYRGLQFV